MKLLNKKILLMTLSMTALIAIGCEKIDDDKISQAQECLDNATQSSDAAGCSSLIAGIYSEKANRIRCALAVLENGTTQTEIVEAYEAMDTGSNDPVIELVTVLGLGDVVVNGAVDAADVAVAQSIKTTCYQSESIGLRTVAELILFGTRAQMAADALGDPENSDDVEGNILLMSDTEAGEFANDVFDLYCVPTFSNDDICNTLSGAGAGTGSDATVGAALKACLNTDSCS